MWKLGRFSHGRGWSGVHEADRVLHPIILHVKNRNYNCSVVEY